MANQVNPSRSERMADQLRREKYECMICTEHIRRHVATWHCSHCFQIFHLFCVKRWASSEGSGAGTSFRCPGCQAPYSSYPSKYFCFCRKRVDPPVDQFLTPHTCGNVCGGARSNGCPHPCNVLCHPGPCPECAFMTDDQSCPCGRTRYRYKCGKPDPKTTCGGTCGRLLRCGIHSCREVCHHGPCPPCDAPIQAICACGSLVKEVVCGAQSGPLSCDQPCGKKRRCGIHDCGVVCHSGSCPPCDTDPSLTVTCPCGKSPIAPGTRHTCTDPVPTCGETCGRSLRCGRHVCMDACHEGECRPCEEKVLVRCPCQLKQLKISCASADTARCERKCKARLSCGRHECTVICCPNRRSADPLHHVCVRLCGRKLPCGHSCSDPCHSGNCAPCPNIIVTDLSCACGSTVLEPPQPCGTQPPKCSRPCQRAFSCGHVALHECHFGDCPKCCERVSRECYGKHAVIANVLCSSEGVSCGAPCGKPLPCGHRCQRACHPGDCDSVNGKPALCNKPCERSLPCGDVCGAKCHGATSDCPLPCAKRITVECQCGFSKATFSCQKFIEMRQATAPGTCLAVPCTDACFVAQRNSFFASKANEASQLLMKGAISTNNPERHYYSMSLWEAAKSFLGILRDAEGHLTSFVRSQEKMRMLPPMERAKRHFLHELSWYFCLRTEAFDNEPNRTVCLHRTPHTRIPRRLLSEVAGQIDYDPLRMVHKVINHMAWDCILVFEAPPEKLTEKALLSLLHFAVGKFVLIDPDSLPLAFGDKPVPARAQPHLGDTTIPFLAVFGKGHDAKDAFATVRREGCPFLFHMYGKTPPPVNFVNDSKDGGPRYFFDDVTSVPCDSSRPTQAPKRASKGGTSWSKVAQKAAEEYHLKTENRFEALR